MNLDILKLKIFTRKSTFSSVRRKISIMFSLSRFIVVYRGDLIRSYFEISRSDRDDRKTFFVDERKVNH